MALVPQESIRRSIGSTSSSPSNRFTSPLDARWFGVVGDNGADDTLPLQKLLTAGAGKSVLIPSATYKITDELTIPAATHVFGEGLGRTIIRQATAGKSNFIIDSVDYCAIQDLSLLGQSASVILLRALTADITYPLLRNIDIREMGAAGVGVDFQTSAAKLVYFPEMENVMVCGGGASSWGTKVGIRLGTAGLQPVVGLNITGGRLWRCRTGVHLVKADTVKTFGLRMDDMMGGTGAGYRFDAAHDCWMYGTRFETATFDKYVEFNAGSADNVVEGIPGAATTALLTNAGTRNSWFGTDGSGGLKNRDDKGPTVFGQLMTFEQMATFQAGFGYAAGSGESVIQLTNKSTNVTLNKYVGKVTMDPAALAAGVNVGFNILNSVVGANDLIINAQLAGTPGYLINTKPNGAGAIAVNVRNITAGSLSESVEIMFMVLKAAIA